MNRFLLLLFLCCFSVSTLNAALTGYLKVGDIKGESQAAGHEDDIDIHGVSWLIERPLVEDGSTRSRGSGQFGDLVVSHRIDKSTPKLMEACANGTVFSEVELTLSKQDPGGAQVDYLVITLTDVIVTSYEIIGSSSEAIPAATVEFAYDELKVVYTEFDDTGAVKGIVETTWKIEEGTP